MPLEGLSTRCTTVVRRAALRSTAIPSRRSRRDSFEQFLGPCATSHALAAHRASWPVAAGRRGSCCGAPTRRLTSHAPDGSRRLRRCVAGDALSLAGHQIDMENLQPLDAYTEAIATQWKRQGWV